MSKRKFNLGEILRKLNEESGTPEVKPHPTGSPIGSPPPYRQGGPYPLSSRASVPQPASPSLPGQPVIGGSESRPAVQETASVTQAQSGGNEEQSAVSPPREYAAARAPEWPERTPASERPPHPSSPPSFSAPARPSEPLPADDEDDEEIFDVFKYIDILLRRKYAVILVVVIATLFSLFRYLKSDTYFVANARLLFRPDNQEIIDDQRYYRYWGDREKIFSTHLELLKSHTVLAMVARNLGDKVTPEGINASLTIKQGETDDEKNDIIELSFRHGDAETARDVLNELCSSYIDYRRDVNAQEITRLVSKFEFQINKLQAELSTKETALREFKETHRMVELSNETNVTINKVADMEMALQQTQLSLLESKERLNELNAHISRQELDVVQSVTYQDPFQNRIADLELELNTVTTEYSPEHFKVKMLRQQIDNLKAATVDSMTREAASKTLVKNPIRESLLQQFINLSIEKSALEAKRVAQEQLIERLNQELVRLPLMEQQYAFLQRETESLLQTLHMLKGKYEEAKIRRDSEESDLKLLELAQTPKNRISSVKFTNILMGLLIGIILGIAFALLLEYLDQTLKEPTAVEKLLSLPLLGIVPFIEADNALLEQVADLKRNILEPFRALRANIKHIAASHRLQTFIVCSAIKGEGKTTLAANLGITFALDGKKVILVDGDLRRSQAHTLFAIPKQNGLADYLVGNASIDDIIKPTRFDNMFVVTSGERPHNPAELLGTVLFDNLIAELRSKADIIIFDSPALLPVSDTITMAPKMDGVLFVVRTFWTPLKAAKQALNQLQRIGSHLYGGILNGASHSGKYYPYYYGYYGYYSYKYSYDEDHGKPFSMRKAGLGIERSVRERLTSLRFALPNYSVALSRGIYRLSRKKTFWLLLVCLLMITGVRLAVQACRPETAAEPVVYMGIGGNRSAVTPEPVGGYSLTDDIAAAGKNAAPSTAVAQRRTGYHGIDDSTGLLRNVYGWFVAFSGRRHSEYCSYYDRTAFSFSGGGFEQWSDAAKRAFGDTAGGSVELDTIRRGAADSSSVEVFIYYRAVTSADTIRGGFSTSWAFGDHGWRIVRQERIPGAYHTAAEH